MKLKDLIEIDSQLKIETESSDMVVDGICDLDFPKSGQLLFIKNKKYLARALDADLSGMGLIIDAKLIESKEELSSKRPAFIVSAEKIDLAVSRLSKTFYDQKYRSSEVFETKIAESAFVHPGALVGKSVVIGENVTIHPNATVMDHCVIGEGSVIYPNATLYPFVEVGSGARIHSGAVIGADGFGYNHDSGVHHKVWHFGGVKIGNDFEIGANSQVDGGTFTPTVIEDGVKLDNNVQIGHNCKLGKGVLICGHVAIGGSSTLGDYTVFGGKSGMGDNMTLGPGCQVAGGALVNTDWPGGTILGGHPARPLKEWMRGIAFVRKESLKK